MRAKYIGCFGTHIHGRQVMSLLCQSDVIITLLHGLLQSSEALSASTYLSLDPGLICRISAYSGTSGSLFLRIKCGI